MGDEPISGTGELPKQFLIGDDLNWDAPWIDVNLWVELPFWLMVNNSTYLLEVEGYEFPVAVHDNYFEMHGGMATDSRDSVCYRGPLKKPDELSDSIQSMRKDNPNLPLIWRKCKTVLKIATRCNEGVWVAAHEEKKTIRLANTIKLYTIALCKAHLPVINKLIQVYRLGTYDYFAFEVAPWDVPVWMVERNSQSYACVLLSYREWDVKPLIFKDGNPGSMPSVSATAAPVPYQLIEDDDLRDRLSHTATPGELELLDALNLMERGDYSGAVRRVTTAIEVVVEAVVGQAIQAKDGGQEAEKFLKGTRNRFDKRVTKYQTLTGRTLPSPLEKTLSETRKLRHRIVHGGHRIAACERGIAQKSVDTGRWTFNWFENDQGRQQLREKRIAFRSLGRDYSIFPARITPDGVVVESIGSQFGKSR